MKLKFYTLITLMLLASFSTLAGVRVTSLELTTEGQTGLVKVTTEGRSNSLPEIRVMGNTIELTMAGAEPFNAISKHVRGAHLSANVLNGKAIVKATLPYNIDAQAVNLGGKNSYIEVIFPRGKASAHLVTPAPGKVAAATVATTTKKETAPKVTIATVEKKSESKLSKDLLNEDYLNKLMQENNTAKTDTETTVAGNDIKNDMVQVKQAAPANVEAKNAVAQAPGVKTDSFSFAGYAAKFTIFLAMVLGLFYGVVQLLKKGVFNRGKLGFLNNGQLIEVLSTTYVSPKKCLMIVRAHKQLFLVANSENGLQFLSEMKDSTGLIKEGEKLVTGVNFDTNLSALEANEAAPTFNLKENINESTPVQEESSLSRIAKATDIVKFSDELKKKAKKLKPIEFN